MAVGGGTNHRFGLYDALLIKDNHVAAAGGVARGREGGARAAPRTSVLQVEVESEDAGRRGARGGRRLRCCSTTARRRAARVSRERFADAGACSRRAAACTLANVRAIAETGVQRISIGALTHSAPAADVALELAAPEEPVSAGPRACSSAARAGDGPAPASAPEHGVSRARSGSTSRRCAARLRSSEPGGGYAARRARPALPEEIQPASTRWLARDPLLDETDSTNRVALELARGRPHGTTVIAEEQTAGRGRLGRSFYSPPGAEPLHLDRAAPELPPGTIAPTLVLASGIAVAEWWRARLGDAARVELKWPNDVLLDGRKTSGILIELASRGDARRPSAVLGIGVNLNVDPATFPEEFRAPRHQPLRRARQRRSTARRSRARLYGSLERVLDLHASAGFVALRPRFDALLPHARASRVRVLEPGGGALRGHGAGRRRRRRAAPRARERRGAARRWPAT